eukprot:g10269.t1
MDAAITMDMDGRVLDWNSQATAQFGWPRDEAVGRFLVDLIIPEPSKHDFKAGLERYRKTGEKVNLGRRVELEALRRDGSLFPVELSATAIEVAGETVFHAYARDISDWRDTEEQLAREKLEARLLHQSATLSLGEMTFGEALQNCLATVCETTGWPIGHVLIPNSSKSKLVSSGFWHLSDEKTYGNIRIATGAAMFTPGQGMPGRIWKSREPLWVENIETETEFTRRQAAMDVGVRGAFGFPVVCDSEVVAILEFFHKDAIRRDPSLLILMRSIGRELGRIVERRAAMEKQTLLATIVETSNDAIISKSIDGTILSWNAGAEQIYGFSADEAIGRPIRIIIPESRHEEESEMRKVLLLGRRLEQFETARIRKDGTQIDVSMSISPIWDSDRKIVGFSTIERDVTAQKRRERELVEARDLAEAANRTKSEFLTNISHELRTPMNAIIGMIELALGEELSDAMTDYLQTACESAHTLLQLLNDLLDFSRMEAGRFEMEPAPFHLRSTLDQTMKMLALRANEKGLELACHVHADVADAVYGDKKRLQQILINLVGNAIKFTEQGEVIIDVEPISQIDDTVVLKFDVVDTGIGISEADQERIFAPFTQADATTTRKYTGTGLGLSICRELVDRMGGELWIESKLGKGSRFSFTICLDALAEEPVTTEQHQPAPEFRDLPVLIVDDNETNRRILYELLTNWQLKPTVVESGKEALDAMKAASKTEGFPLIFVDALMPKMDGFSLIEKARKKGILKGSAVLMLSSADRQLFQERCTELEIAAYLEKPISQSGLFDAVMTALHRRDQRVFTAARIEETDHDSLEVLVVEDTPANQKVVRAILNKRGHNVTIAGNGRDGIDLLKQSSFDVVLMDIQMPTMDGIQATKAIRKFDDETAGIPIIAMTAHAMRGDRKRCLDAGMDAYISKPIDAIALVDLVEKLGSHMERAPSTSLADDTDHAESNGNGDGNGREAPEAPVAAVETESESRIDREAAMQRLGNDEELFADMIGFFIEDSPQLIQMLREGLAEGDMVSVQRAAHSLKGLASNFGASSVVEKARVLEMAAKGRRKAEAESLFPELEIEIKLLAAGDGVELVVAAGGDGTVNSIAQGIQSSGNAACMGILPTGTGNDLARSLAMPLDLLQAAQLLIEHQDTHVRSIDTALLETDSTERPFVNMATGGNSGQFTQQLTDEMKSFWGALCYLRGTLTVMANLKVFDLRVSYDGGTVEEFRALNVFIANGRTSGGGLNVAPRASLEDRLLDTIIVKDGPPVDLAILATRYVAGDFHESDLIVFRQARRLSIEADPPITFTVDGDVATESPAEFSIQPEQLRVVVGPEYQPTSPVADSETGDA